ncbi:hypothetical protein HNQ56_001410 [Anaerotaenia torta]
MSELKVKMLHSLEKVFPDQEPDSRGEDGGLSALWGEEVSFQMAYCNDSCQSPWVTVQVISPLKEHIRVRKVDLVPSRYPAHVLRDEDYLKGTPGMFPDLLKNLQENRVRLIQGQWRSLWIDVAVSERILPGTYPVRIELREEAGCAAASIDTQIEVIGVRLPDLNLKHTEWFHGDCLADYYNVKVFSKKHWDIMDSFIETAARRNCNMILVPMFTPPLDTKIGGERTTIQLVDVKVGEGQYHFNFDRLKRFITLCRKKGIRYYEMSHLFTQWGAKAAPKIMAMVEGNYQRIFGWDTPSAGGEYENFLNCYLPSLTEKLKEWGIQDVTYFHISDEPGKDDLGSYKKAWEIASRHLKDFHIIDAISDYEFYKNGLVKEPVCATDHIEPFLENKTENLWAYYCTGQARLVSNRFMAMPSYRNRIYGIQVYQYRLTGILHWGYNFYNSQNSLEYINPYENTDSSESFPSGDSFLVYPGTDGRPEESIRIMVLDEALNDYRAMQLLEQLAGRDKVSELIEKDCGGELTFSQYPRSAEYLLTLRASVNQEIKKQIAGLCNPSGKLRLLF